MVWSEGENFTQGPLLNAHGTHRLALGGGSAGLEGTLLGGLTGGFKIPVAERHGPVFRAGAFGYMRGNDAFYASLLELPRIEVGYQLLAPTVVVEIGISSGAVLTGRSRIGDTYARHLGSGLEVGAYASARVPWFRVALSALRLPSGDEIGTPARALEGTLCALAAPMAICADSRIAVADQLAYGANVVSEATSSYTGLTVGLTADR